MDRIRKFLNDDSGSLDIRKEDKKWNNYTVYTASVKEFANVGTPIFVLENSEGVLRYCDADEVYPIIYFLAEGLEEKNS